MEDLLLLINLKFYYFMIRISILIIAFLVQFSCSDKPVNENLYEIDVCMLGYPSTGLDEILICNRNYCDTISLISSLGNKYSSFKWSNKDSLIICTEYVNGVHNLVYLNQGGEVVARIFQFDRKYPVYNIFPSSKESLVLFQYRFSETPLSIEKDANYPSNLGVVDINNDSIVCIIEGIVPIQMVNINVSPWSPDESKFLFTVSSGPKFIINGIDSLTKYNYKLYEPGVYEYDLTTKSYNLVIKNASSATWSPDGKYIIYLLDNCLYRSSPDFLKKELLYDAGVFERISRGLYWLNNGECLLFRSFISPFGIRMLTTQEVKLIWMDDMRSELTNLMLLNGLYDIKDEGPL